MFVFHDFRDHAPALRLLRVQDLGLQEQFGDDGGAEDANQVPQLARRHRKSEPTHRHTEPRAGGADPDVAHRCDLEAASDACTADRRDDGNVAVSDSIQRRRHRLLMVGLDLVRRAAQRFELGNVGAGRKRFRAGTGNHDATNVPPLAKRREFALKVRPHARGQCIELPWMADRDTHHVPVLDGGHARNWAGFCVVGHDFSPSRECSRDNAKYT